jgi:spermidine/putrescine transport system ATP-binding protein
MNVADNVGYGLRQARPKLGRGEIDRRVAETLELVRLPQMGARRTWELSGGQQQRVALARALVNRPTVLLLDEPLAALDRKLRREMQIELQNLQREVGITFILVTHDQEEALSMSDRIAVMRSGRVEQVGEPQVIYRYPATAFVAGFVGTTNLFRGTVAQRNGDTLEVTIDGGSLRARGDIGQPGDRVEISLRPEAFRVLAPGEVAPAGWSTLSGSLGEVEYLGATTRLHLRLPGDARLQLTVGAPPASGGDIAVAYAPALATVWSAS